MTHFHSIEEIKPEFTKRTRRALLLTTVPVEGQAVIAHLSNVMRVSAGNGVIYRLGVFHVPAGDWHVVQLTTLPGNSAVASAARRAHGDFGAFDVLMFVGVAGSLKSDVPIGSVVVSENVYNFHGAKVEDDATYSRPKGYPASRIFVHAAQMIIEDMDWVTFIKAPFGGVLPEPEMYPKPYPPSAFLKSIASGEQVVAGAQAATYKLIRESYNDAVAVEMEGFGAMMAACDEGTPAIVVRGISDMCEGKTASVDAERQPVAAAHAAAFAFAMLALRSQAAPDASSSVIPDLPVVGVPLSELVNYVLNFRGNPSSFPPSRVDELVGLVRQITNDPDVEFVRIDAGSVRVVMRVRESDLVRLAFPELKAALGAAGDDLLGAGTESVLGPADIAKATLLRASTHLLRWQRFLPDGRWLERPEKSEIEGRFSNESSSTVLLGEPGAGKSALLAAIAVDLADADVPFLAIKADSIGVDVCDEQTLQADLGLPDLPGNLIENLAKIQPVYLLIDQLDALANQVDLKSDRLNVLLNLVRRVGGQSNIHVLLSARTFEFGHDVRLRAINAEAIGLALPAWHEVAASLKDSNVDADAWPERARDVVRNPQALKTFLSLAKTNDSAPFSKYQELLEQLWRVRVLAHPNGQEMAALALEMAGVMAESEVLWLAASRFDARASTVTALESVGLLVRSDDSKRLGFSHQTVFDFILARDFVGRVGRLSTYVLHRQNSLFVRAKLWAALTYMRDAELVSYEREFSEIWRTTSLRRHLRLLLISFLGGISQPTIAEQTWFQEAMHAPDLRVSALKAIAGSRCWFDLFADTDIPAAMTGSETETQLAGVVLQRAWVFKPDSVARLIVHCWLEAARFDPTTWWVLNACTSWSVEVERIAHVVVQRSAISASSIDFAASSLAVEQPGVALRLVRSKLDLLLIEAVAHGSPVESEADHDDETAGWQDNRSSKRTLSDLLETREFSSLPDIAQASPLDFMSILWPWYRTFFMEFFRRTPQRTVAHEFAGGYGVDLGLPGDMSERYSLEHPLASALSCAIERLAIDHSVEFEQWASENGSAESMPIQRLIGFGFSKAPAAYAGQAHAWLLSDLRRLQLGNLGGHRGTTALLVSAVASHWTDLQLAQFESVVLGYKPETPAYLSEVKSRRYFSEDIRRTKAHLLSLLPYARIGQGSQAFLTSARLALGEEFDTGIRHMEGGVIGSPMSAEAMGKAKDRDIITIFQEVPDSTHWDHPHAWMRGGNIQLSRAFAEFAKANPIRAFAIIDLFKPELQERAAGYALDSIAENAGHDPDVIKTILTLDARGFCSEDFRHSAAHAVEKMTQRDVIIDETVVDLLARWIETWPCPEKTSSEPETNSGGATDADCEGEREDAGELSILWGMGGMTILPGGRFPLFSALTSALLNKGAEGRDRLIALLDGQLSRERNLKVWKALLYRLSNSGATSPAVVTRFIRKLFAHHPSLARSREAIIFLAHAQNWDNELVYEVIEPWNRGDDPWLEQAQGELVGLVAAVRGGPLWVELQESLLRDGSEHSKVGLAFAGANLWSSHNFHSAAGSLLTRLLPDAPKVVVSAVLDVFRLCDRLAPNQVTLKFLEALAQPSVDLSGASTSFFVERLQSVLPHAQDQVGTIALKLVESWKDELADIRTGTSLAAPELTDLAITLHRLGGRSRGMGVAVFEALLDIDAYGTRETLAEIDGRFDVPQTGVRRRVARRAARHSRRSQQI